MEKPRNMMIVREELLVKTQDILRDCIDQVVAEVGVEDIQSLHFVAKEFHKLIREAQREARHGS
jgi:hypothetical protein